jgi:hypoxanthine-guanine phosphoribosyltransferase
MPLHRLEIPDEFVVGYGLGLRGAASLPTLHSE